VRAIAQLVGLASYVAVGSALLAHLAAPNGVAAQLPKPTPMPEHFMRVPERLITITIHTPDRTIRCTTSTDLVGGEDISVPSEELDSVYVELGCNH